MTDIYETGAHILKLEQKIEEIKKLIEPHLRIRCSGWSCCAYCSTLENLAEEIKEVTER